MTIRVRHLALAALSVATASAFAQQKSSVGVPSETDVLVRMVPGTNAKLVDAAIGAVEISKMPQIGWRTIRVSKSFGAKRALNYYNSNKSVLEAQIPVKAVTFETTNDPSFSRQYSLPTMRVPAAWDLTLGSTATTIAIIDSGLDLKHPEFPADKVVKGYDFSNDDDDVTPEDPKADGHGTHVAGIAAAATNNGIGISGVGYNCKIMPLKVFPNSYTPNITKAVLFAADNGAKVINMSLGYQGDADRALGDAITYAVGKGVTVVCAAGNSGLNNDLVGFFPTNYPNVISVGASDRFDRKADFSNYGTKVLVAAPGVDVYSTLPTGDSSYGAESGTSMASPNTAGVVGLMYSYAAASNYNLTPGLVRKALLSSTDSIGTGFVATGRVNAQKALIALRPARPTTLDYVLSGVYDKPLKKVPASLKTKGGGSVNVPMKFEAGLGQSSAYVMQFRVPAAVDFSNFVSSTLNVNASIHNDGVAVPQSTLQLYLWNFNLGRYQQVSQITMKSDATFNIPTNQTAFRDSNGLVQAMVRGFVPLRTGNPRSGSVLTLDFLGADVTYRSFN